MDAGILAQFGLQVQLILTQPPATSEEKRWRRPRRSTKQNYFTWLKSYGLRVVMTPGGVHSMR